MSEAFFKLTELRDRLALDGMDRKQIGDLIERMTQDSPNRVWYMPYNAVQAAKAIGWNIGDQTRVQSAALRARR